MGNKEIEASFRLGMGKRRTMNRKKVISKKRSTLKHIGNIFIFMFCSVLVFIIIISCITMFNASSHPGKTPSIFGYKTMSVLTGSMEPKIMPGDLVISNNIKDLNSIKVGTIVTYKNKYNTLITHRVVKVNNKNGVRTYITKGDANPVPDVDAVAQNQLEGVYSIRVPYVGFLGMFVKSGPGIITLIIIPLLLLLGLETKNYFSKPRVKSV